MAMIQRFLRNKVIAAVLSILFGIYLVIVRKNVVDGVIRMAGYASLAAGVAYLLYYLFGPAKDQVQIGYAAMLGISGLLLIWLAPAIRDIFPILAGVVLILAGVSNLTGARSALLPWYVRLFPILIIALGAVILFNPGKTVDIVVLLIGVGLILNGVNELDLVHRIRSL